MNAHESSILVVYTVAIILAATFFILWLRRKQKKMEDRYVERILRSLPEDRGVPEHARKVVSIEELYERQRRTSQT